MSTEVIILNPIGITEEQFQVIEEMAAALKSLLAEELHALKALSIDELLAQRYKKFMAMGACD